MACMDTDRVHSSHSLAEPAARWLHDTLLPLALAAAGLPAETGLDELLARHLPVPGLRSAASTSSPKSFIAGTWFRSRTPSCSKTKQVQLVP